MKSADNLSQLYYGVKIIILHFKMLTQQQAAITILRTEIKRKTGTFQQTFL